MVFCVHVHIRLIMAARCVCNYLSVIVEHSPFLEHNKLSFYKSGGQPIQTVRNECEAKPCTCIDKYTSCCFFLSTLCLLERHFFSFLIRHFLSMPLFYHYFFCETLPLSFNIIYFDHTLEINCTVML